MDPVAGFEPIGLDDLVAAADLQTRIDRKYLVPVADLSQALAELEDVRALELDGLRAFAYRSTYFDTPELEAHAAAAHRRRRRFKVRTRRYPDAGAAWLEVKTRGPRGTTVKHRTPHPGDEAVLDAPALAFVREQLRAAEVAAPDLDRLTPVLRTTFRRSTLLLAGNVRVTLDLGLAWTRPDGATWDAGPVAVVETKTPPDAGRCELDRVLIRRGIRPGRISKYGAGLALAVPTAPHNRWHRALSGPLADTTRR